MTADFVEYNAAEAAVYNDRESACRAFARVKHGNGLLRGNQTDFLRVDQIEALKAHAVAGREKSGLHGICVGSDRLNGHAHPRASVGRKHSFAVAYENVFVVVKKPCYNLCYFG